MRSVEGCEGSIDKRFRIYESKMRGEEAGDGEVGEETPK